MLVMSVLLLLVDCTDDEERKTPDGEFSMVLQMQRKVTRRYNRLRLLLGADGARHNTAEWLSSLGNIRSAGIAADGHTIWGILEDGTEIVFLCQ